MQLQKLSSVDLNHTLGQRAFPVFSRRINPALGDAAMSPQHKILINRTVA